MEKRASEGAREPTVLRVVEGIVETARSRSSKSEFVRRPTQRNVFSSSPCLPGGSVEERKYVCEG